jgi:hypothetical protein
MVRGYVLGEPTKHKVISRNQKWMIKKPSHATLPLMPIYLSHRFGGCNKKLIGEKRRNPLSNNLLGL